MKNDFHHSDEDDQVDKTNINKNEKINKDDDLKEVNNEVSLFYINLRI